MPRDPREAAREAAAQVRREMLQCGLNEAEMRGDAVRAEKYRATIATIPAVGIPVIDLGESLMLLTVNGILDALKLGAMAENDAIKALVETGLTEEAAWAMIRDNAEHG